ncbi:hypothetical protein J4210_02505 [Candidatus Woesearchaeota archaeon]|nr:hypothetical protein [Candidatus Woesearchaeota archaeon]MBS3169332.1 hypothetical protein [Candidatus Woesearchaeota archaeon]
MAKFPEAEARLFKNIFVDRKTKRKIRANPLKVQAGKVRGRGIGAGTKLKPKRKK